MSDLFISNLPPGVTAATPVEKRLLAEYGAMFVAQGVTVPNNIVFRDEEEVSEFQARIHISHDKIGGVDMELQSAAMDALLKAEIVAEQKGLSISPRDSDSARRSYRDTVELWASRVEPALDHWESEQRLDRKDAERIRSLSPYEQVPVILQLEEDGIYFAKDLSKSIIYSVAPPGASQHLSLLAFDIKEHANENVRAILARHFWFQTVVSDLPHFTYLGVEENELPNLGLKNIENGGRTFWIPGTQI